MKDADTVNFVDKSSNDEACVIVRYDDDTVGLAMSLASNGDLEVFMTKSDARKVMDALALATK